MLCWDPTQSLLANSAETELHFPAPGGTFQKGGTTHRLEVRQGGQGRHEGPLTWMDGNAKPTMKLVNQCTAPSTVKAAVREDCRTISVLTTEGTGPGWKEGSDGPEGLLGPHFEPQTLEAPYLPVWITLAGTGG